MKLLVDENLAPRLAADLADLLPDTVHAERRTEQQSDLVIWEYAKAHRLVILLQTGNCSTAETERIVRNSAIRSLISNDDSRRSLLILK